MYSIQSFSCLISLHKRSPWNRLNMFVAPAITMKTTTATSRTTMIIFWLAPLWQRCFTSLGLLMKRHTPSVKIVSRPATFFSPQVSEGSLYIHQLQQLAASKTIASWMGSRIIQVVLFFIGAPLSFYISPWFLINVDICGLIPADLQSLSLSRSM